MLLRLTTTLLFVSCLLFGQAQPQLSLSQSGPTAVYPGATVNLNVNLSGSTGQSLAGLQWTHNLVPSSTLTLAPGAASNTATKGLYCNTAQTLCLLTGLTGTAPNQVVSNNVFADGVVSTISMVVPTTTSPGSQSLSLTNLFGVSNTGFNVQMTAAAPISLNILSFCDFNGDGKTDTTDLQTAINQAVGKASCSNDLTGDGQCNAIDVQRVIIAAGGGSCRTGQ